MDYSERLKKMAEVNDITADQLINHILFCDRDTPMSGQRSLEDLRATIAGLKHYEGSKIKHIKSNGYYVITGIHFKEDDMSVWFSYETMHHDPVSFLRPISELFDGRFQI